ncbi:sporulation integral membrane protein YtvI [Herbinix luporum]|jgi:sporulation integral membrane protein YtvI|uniref:sporulation integral membrane protein YtvI n=1 Tax=Herbinix luporum TaxID=1679721 RepID=UPI00176D56FB|nr:sporulation integral membrane protein YtvI [Herbinix luporum]HHT56531.1 sporulation integral membrane protein YtvI [Herbinix luporum]
MEIWDTMNDRVKFFIKGIIIILGVYLGFRFILPLILPFIFAYFLAWIVRPVTEFLYKKIKIPRIIGGSISLILLLSIIGTGLFYLGNMLIKQALNFARNIPVYLNVLAGRLDNICSSCDELLGLAAGSVRAIMDENMLSMVNKVKTDMVPGLTAKTLYYMVKFIGFIGILLIIFISAVLIVKEVPELKTKYKNTEVYNDFNKVFSKLAEAGMAYFRSQLLIMAMVAIICVIGLVLIKNQYALLLGLGIALLDALPVIGSGMILIPWSIMMLFDGNIYAAAILITTYLICQIIREVLEPKLIGNRIGVKPLYTLISMYMGLKLFGVAGFILGPVALIIIITIVKVIDDKETRAYTLDKGTELE